MLVPNRLLLLSHKEHMLTSSQPQDVCANVCCMFLSECPGPHTTCEQGWITKRA